MNLRITRCDSFCLVALCMFKVHMIHVCFGVGAQIIKTVDTGAHPVIHCRLKRGSTSGDGRGDDETRQDKALKLVTLQDMRGIQREVRACSCDWLNVRRLISMAPCCCAPGDDSQPRATPLRDGSRCCVRRSRACVRCMRAVFFARQHGNHGCACERRNRYVQMPWCSGGSMARWLAESQPPHSVSVTHAGTLLFEVLRVCCVERGASYMTFPAVAPCVVPCLHPSLTMALVSCNRAWRTCMAWPLSMATSSPTMYCWTMTATPKSATGV